MCKYICYMNAGECVACADGKTSKQGSVSAAECGQTCGLPSTPSQAASKAPSLVAATSDISVADDVVKAALVDFIKAVNEENEARKRLEIATAFKPPPPPTLPTIVKQSYTTSKSDLGGKEAYYLDGQNVDCLTYPLQVLRSEFCLIFWLCYSAFF